ncbi:MAG: SWIM zinc finger family protein [Gemmataceae bacterium]
MSIVLGNRNKAGRVPALQRQRFYRWYRAVRWLRRPNAASRWGAFAIKMRYSWSRYFVREIPFDVPGGRGFFVKSASRSTTEVYHVELTTAGTCRCDCAGFTQRGKCRHAAAVAELVDRGDFPSTPAALRTAA